MAILTDLLYYQESIIDNTQVKNYTWETNRPNTSAQSINLPWLNQESTSSRNTSHTSRGSTPCSKRSYVTLSHLSPIRKTQDQSLASALQETPFQP
ncbi:15297_t:CDS:2 [Rhizophagus irregularis]|nr:15297_t:CDS:2 [Rhizophagus irregularis]